MDKITAQTAQIAQISGNFEGGGKNILSKKYHKLFILIFWYFKSGILDTFG